MAQRAITQKIQAPDLGIITSIPPDAINPRAWSGGLNVRFKDGYVETSPGWEKFTSQDIGSPIAAIEQFFLLDGVNYVVLVATDGVWYYDTGSDTWLDITGDVLTAVIDDYISSDTWPDTFIFTNNKDRVQKWLGTGVCASLAGLDTAEGASGTVDVDAAKSVCVFSSFVHLANTREDATRFPQRWRWSRFNNAEGWSNVGTYGQAGYADLTDGPDHLMVTRRLGNDYMALYKEHSIHIGQYVGPPTIWARRLVVSNIGLRAPGAVADLGDEHIFLGDDNFYVFNGLAVKPIGQAIFNTFIDELDPDKVEMVKAYVIDEDNEVWFIYPTSGNDTPNRMVVYNYISSAWSFRDAPFTCIGRYRESLNKAWNGMPLTWEDHPERWDSRLWTANNPIILAGGNDGFVQQIGAGVYGQDGSNHESYVITKALDMSRPDILKRWLRIFLDMVKQSSYNLEISFATLNSVHDTPTFGAAVNYDMALSGKPYKDIDQSGRWLFVKFRTNHTTRPWKLSGYGFEYIERGRY